MALDIPPRITKTVHGTENMILNVLCEAYSIRVASQQPEMLFRANFCRGALVGF